MTRRSIFRWPNPQCGLCRLPLRDDDHLWCQTCLTSLPQPPYCQHCGATTLDASPHCGFCLRTPPHWDRLVRLGEYGFPLNRLIQQFKFQRQFWLGPPLARLLAAQITAPAPLLLPVPLHPWRRLLRGFNQSTVLATALAASLNTTVDTQSLRRIQRALPQHQLSRQARLQNLQQAFILKERKWPEHVAIVDDVVTTGSTVSVLSRLLREQGVRQIDIYCLGFTPPPKVSVR
ncbi:ComF family protein [Photobacterium sp. GJ3]|uniref:ComF family protein n=1 Tax=Photobacterium sp. GJ3 TaxID=2829502 RepID=UPI0020135A33|nr:phosphoribosyltransferase family protein [Photobacterium sp. GJ3]